jgi:tetratricopeptide (TPR) repeat protein
MERLSKLYPSNVDYAIQLGGNSCNMGRWLVNNGDPKEALEWFNKAQAALEGVLRRDKGNANARNFLWVTHWQRTDALLKLERLAESLREWDRALELTASETQRASTGVSRAYALARLGKYEQAAPVAEEFAGRPSASDFAAFRAARVLSLASAAVYRDPQRAEGERRQLARRYADAAVALLLRLQSQGYFKDRTNVTYLEKDKEFDPLRGRDDFQKLLAELKTKAAPK